MIDIVIYSFKELKKKRVKESQSFRVGKYVLRQF